ncbi:MAG: carbamoyltransferase C-terminal domain-containing protein [Sneathiella sp.]
MNILGINYIFHDSSACIVKDGELIVALEDERFTRDKHSQKFPVSAIEESLRFANMTIEEIDHIALSVNPGKNTAEKLAFASKLNGGSKTFIEYEFHRLRERHLGFWTWFHEHFPDDQAKKPEVHFIDHHLAHIAGSYFVSPWDKAALLSIDGWGEWTTTWMGVAEKSDIQCLNESVFPHSLGVFYSAATEFCGFKPNYDEGKTMGLAPMGDPMKYYNLVKDMVKISPEGQVKIDLSWFGFQTLSGKLCSDKFYEYFGPAREGNSPIDDNHKDIAAAFQLVLEEKVLEICEILGQKTNAKHLVLGGGVALNSVMNGRIIRETQFEDIYVMPGAGDNGTCIGAAYQLYNGMLGETKRYHHIDPYMGTEYSDDAIIAALKDAKLKYRHTSDVFNETAEMLSSGKIVGWFQGRMEFGPRALGNRSILANPTLPGMKDKINAEVKHREAFRPFAPSIPVEDKNIYFDIEVDAPFMLKVCSVHENKRDLIPAIVHVDGTARLQTVCEKTNPRYHKLLKAFGGLTGHPVLLNSSFNVMGEPIVESPLHAIRCFFSTGLDALVIGDFVVEK